MNDLISLPAFWKTKKLVVSVMSNWLLMPPTSCEFEMGPCSVRASQWTHRLTFKSTAGSETTATTLSCITYYLLQYPRVMKILRSEIDSAFNSYDDINATTASNLKYLHAVALEGMRIYAPLPFALPRMVPEGGDTVDGHLLPGGVNHPLNLQLAAKAVCSFILGYRRNKSGGGKFVRREL